MDIHSLELRGSVALNQNMAGFCGNTGNTALGNKYLQFKDNWYKFR